MFDNSLRFSPQALLEEDAKMFVPTLKRGKKKLIDKNSCKLKLTNPAQVLAIKNEAAEDSRKFPISAQVRLRDLLQFFFFVHLQKSLWGFSKEIYLKRIFSE